MLTSENLLHRHFLCWNSQSCRSKKCFFCRQECWNQLSKRALPLEDQMHHRISVSYESHVRPRHLVILHTTALPCNILFQLNHLCWFTSRHKILQRGDIDGGHEFWRSERIYQHCLYLLKLTQRIALHRA